MRRRLTSRPLLLLLLFHVPLSLASSRVGGLRSFAEGDASLVVFSSFPTFAPGTGAGPRAPSPSASHSNFKEESRHDVTSDPHLDLPLATDPSGTEGRALAEDNAGKEDDPKTGIFLFSTLTQDHPQETSTDAEGLTTLIASEVPDETTTVSDATESSAPPTDGPDMAPEEGSSPPLLTTSHPSTSTIVQESGGRGTPDVTEASVAPGSLASLLQRRKSNPRPSAKPARKREENEDSPQQMTLAERLKALQARRAARLGSQARSGTGLLRRDNSSPQSRESPVQRRLGDFSVGDLGGDTRQRPLTVEPKISFIAPPPEIEGERQVNVNEHDMVGEEASQVPTTQAEPPSPEASPPTSRRPALKKRPRLSYTDRLRTRLQELRERRQGTPSPRPRVPRPESIGRPRPTPEPGTENTTDALTPSQRRRLKFIQRIRNRTFTTRAPSGPAINAPQEKGPETTSEAPVINQPPRRLSFRPTTKRPLSFREKIQQFRSRNRFVPSSKRRQLTSTTTATTTTTTSTTPPPTTVTSTPPPTTIGTTPALAVNTWPVTEASDDDNLLITVPSTTELTEDSRRHQIRKMIDAMLSSKGFSGPTTTEEVLSILEAATSRPVFLHTTDSLLRNLPEHSGISRPTFSVLGVENKEGRSETSPDDFLTTITESVSLPTTQRPAIGFARDRQKPFRQFTSLADKLAASHAPKRSKFEPSPAPLPPTTEESSSTILPGISSGALDGVFGMAEETDADVTTLTSDVEISTPSPSGFTAVGAEEDETHSTTQEPLSGTTAEDQRVKNLISKLLEQGVITMPFPEDSETVTPSMEDALPASTSDSPPPAPMPSPRPTEPQLTRGAPPSRTPVGSGTPFTDNPLVSTVKMMDTTARFSDDNTEVTEIPQPTTPDDTLLQTDIFQTTPPTTEAGDSLFGIAGDLGENEIDAVNSKDNLHSLMRSFGRPSVRPELAAVNQVLGFSLTTGDEVSPVEVNLEKPQTPEEEDMLDNLEIAATEQVMITTNLRDEDLAPTPHNLDVTSLSVSEPSPQIHSATEATSLTTAGATGEQLSETGREEQAAPVKETVTSVEGNLDAGEPPVTVLAIAVSEPPATQTPTTTPSVSDAVDSQDTKELPVDKPSGLGSLPAAAAGTLMPNLTPENQPGRKNVTTTLQKFLSQGAHAKTDGSPTDPTDAFHGVSEAVMRERLHLLRLMRERQGGRAGQETRTTSESPLTTSKVSLSELIRKKTPGEVTGLEMTPRPPLGESITKSKPTATTAAPEPPLSADTSPEQTENTSKTSDAMRRFLELNKHVLQALRAKKKTASSTEVPPPTPSTLPTTPSMTAHPINDLGIRTQESKPEEIPPVITQVTPQSQITTTGTPKEQSQPLEGEKARPSSLLRPVSQLPDRSETPSPAIHSPGSAFPSSVKRPTSHERESLLMKKQGPSTPRPAMTTPRSRLPPPSSVRRPRPPTRFSLSRQDSPEQQSQRPGAPFFQGPAESVVEGPQTVSTTSRPLLQPFSTTQADDVPTMDTTTPGELTDDASQPLAAQTERPNTFRVTTLASLLSRKHLLGNRFHQTKQKPTLLPKTTTEKAPETTKLPEDGTLAPVTLPPQEETTIIPQRPDDELQTSAPHVDQSRPKPSDDSLKAPSAKGTTAATEGMTAEHVPPPFTSPDTNLNFRQGFQGRPTGAFQPGVSSFSIHDDVSGVPLPFLTSGPPHTVFPTTTPPSIQFVPTHVTARFPSRETTHGLDTSATTEAPSSFPANPQDFTDERNTLTPPSFSLDLDTSTPPFGFNFQLQQEPFNPEAGLPSSLAVAPATNDGPLNAGDDVSPGTPLSFITTSAPGFASFTLGRNEAFFSDDEPRATTYHPPLTGNPVITTPVTNVTPQVILLALPVINGSLVATTVLPEEDTETHVPMAATGRENEEPIEKMTPPDLMHMITKGVTITSTEGVINRLPPVPAPESPPPPPHSGFVPPPTDPTFLNLPTKEDSAQNTLHREDERVRLRFASESPSQVVPGEQGLGAAEDKKLGGQTTFNEQQVLVDADRRPSLQAGHLNLNELRQHHPGGQVTEKVSQGLATPSGFQEQQLGSQLFLGQPNVPQQQSNVVPASQKDRPVRPGQHITDTQFNVVGGDAISNQQTAGVSQAHNEGQIIADHRNIANQHISDAGQALPGRHGGVQSIDEQTQGTPTQHNVVKQHTAVQGQVVQGHFDTVNGNTFEQRKGITGHGTTANQQILGQGQVTQGSTGVQNVNERGQILGGQQSTSQHIFNQEQGIPNQHVSGVQQHNVHQHDTQIQQNSQGHVLHGQHSPQAQVVQSQHNRQKQVIQAQHNLQGQVIEGQHNQEGPITQDQRSPQGQISQVQQDQQGQVIQGQHDPQGQVIGGQHNQQAQILQDQHNSHRQILQDQHNPQTQHIQQPQSNQGQHHQQGQAIQGHHNQQGQVIQSQDIPQEQLVQGQHHQGHVIQDQHSQQGQVLLGQHAGAQDTHAVSEGQQNTRGQDVTQEQILEGQDVILGQIRQGQDGTQEQASQGQGVVQGQSSHGQVSQGRDVIQGQVSQGQGDIHQGQVSQGQDAIQEQTGRGQQVTQGPNIQEQDVIQEEVTEEQITTTQHTLQEGEVVTLDNPEHQRDTSRRVTEAQGRQQVQNRPQPRQSSRRGKFISGDAVLEAQQIAPAKNAEGKLTVQNVHGSGGPIIRGQSVVPPLRGSQQRQTARGQTLGHFSNTAAGFLRGPANSVITGFASLGGDTPAGGGEGEVLTTVFPAVVKTSGPRLSVGHDVDGDEIPGQAGVDYPVRTSIPATAFRCTPAMVNMMFADPDTQCQVYHVCSGHQKFSFLCPKGTLFNQDTSVCQWWFTVDCARQARRLAEVRGLAAG